MLTIDYGNTAEKFTTAARPARSAATISSK
jgi:hypothetical protein